MDVLFISKSIRESCGVGSARSRVLYELLTADNHNVDLISDELYSKWNIVKGILCNKYNKIYFSGPPFGSYLIVLLVACLLVNNKLYVDFRDPWSFNVGKNYGLNNQSKFKCIIAKLIEKLVYLRCRKFIVCTDVMKDIYRDIFGNDKKIIVIKNGHEFTYNDLLGVASKNFLNKDVINMICCGKFGYYNNNICDTLTIKLSSNVKKFNILFVGTDKFTKEYFERKQFPNINVSFINQLKYREVIPLMKNADVGLLSLRYDDIDIGTKVYDYVGLGLPIYSLFSQNSALYKTFNEYIIDNFDNKITILPDFKMNYSRKGELKKLIREMEC